MDEPKAPHALCHQCPLAEEPFVGSTVPPQWRCSLLLVGEAPGEQEVAEHKPFVGRSGQLLSRELSRASIDRDECYITNAVLCRPPGNRMADYPEAVACCRPRLVAEIQQAKPAVILAMGATALETVLPDVQIGIMQARGLHTYSSELKAKVVVTVHPAFLLYMPNQALNFRKDLATLYETRPEVPETVFDVIASEEELRRLPSKIIEDTSLFDPHNEDGAEIACDTETSDYSPYKGRLLSVQLSWQSGHAVVIPEQLLSTDACREVLREIFALPNVAWWGHNFAFDYLWLKAYGFEPPKLWWDTMVMHYTTDETPGGHGLKAIAMDMLSVPNWEVDLGRYLKRKSDSFSLIPPPVLHRYGARDADVNRQLTRSIVLSMDESGKRAYKDVLQPAQLVLAEMEAHGMLLDVDKLHDLLDKYNRKRNDMLYYMQQMTWADFNPNSPKQVGTVLFDELGFRGVKSTPKGQWSTDDEVLDELMLRDPSNKFLHLLSEYRSIDKVITTYLEGLETLADDNHVVHPDFNIIGTMTGRLTAGRYLTLPRVTKNKWAGAVRDLIIARPGYLIVGADYNQAELRVMACEAREDVWREMWEAGRNIHDEMCRLLFGVGKKDDYEKYMIAKMFTFGLGYGRTPQSIALQLKWPVERAEMFYAKYMDAIPAVKAWQRWIIHEVQTVGILETAFGRKRRFPLITPATRKHIFNEALNDIPQSTASDLALMSMTRYYHEMVKAQIGMPILMLHDGIYLEALEDKAEAAGARLKTIMEEIPATHYDTYVPFTAEAKVGRSWGEAERGDV